MADGGGGGPAERHTCATCPASYTSRNNLDRHVREKHTGQQHVCDRCGATFARRYRLEAHVRTHTAGAEPFQCTLCPATAPTRASLARHVRCHAGAGGRTACPVCGQLFRHYWLMKLHRRHHGAARHSCPRCRRLFRHGRTLADHLAQHGPPPPPPPEPPGGGAEQLQIELDSAELDGRLGAELARLLGHGLRVEVEERSRVGETVMVITLVDE